MVEAILTAGIHNFTCEQGATFRRVVTWSDEDGNAINLAGCTARMQVRNTHEAASPILSLSSADLDPAITIEDDTGKITIVIDAATTAGLEEGPTVYDLEVILANSEVTRLIQGQFIISPEVTR
jgi:molybdenum cofactor biosynthesis enzyme